MTKNTHNYDKIICHQVSIYSDGYFLSPTLQPFFENIFIIYNYYFCDNIVVH